MTSSQCSNRNSFREEVMKSTIISTVISATGLPEDLVKTELSQLSEQQGFNIDTMTIEQLRIVLSDYVQDVLVKLKENLESETP